MRPLALFLTMAAISILVHAGLRDAWSQPDACCSFTIIKNQGNLEVMVVVPEGRKVNPDAPWSLRVGGIVARKEGSFDKSLPGFVVERKKIAPGGEDFKATVYTCTKDATECYSDRISGRFVP